DNRLVARGLERDWEERLRALETAKIELERREKERPRVISQAERDRLFTRTRSGRRLERTNDHPARQEGAATHPHRRGHDQGRSRQGGRQSRAALEGWRAQRYRAHSAALAARYRPHRRGHDRAVTPARGPLPRWCDRR